MAFIRNARGMALVTALMITAITLVIVAGLLTILGSNTRLQASQKIYRNAVEASYGGADVMLNEVIRGFFAGNSLSSIKSTFPAAMEMDFLSSADGSGACLQDKLAKDPSEWVATCTAGAATQIDPRVEPDVRFVLRGTAGQKFVVYSKIVDTVPGTPYVHTAFVPLEGGGVASSGNCGIGGGEHYVYRVEVAGEQESNPAEKGELSMLYEY